VKFYEALHDPTLLGSWPAFTEPASIIRWTVLARAIDGEPLSEAELEVWRKHTGRATYTSPPGGFSEVVVTVGRQSGKSTFAAAFAVNTAALARRDPRGRIYVLLISQDARAARRVLFDYATGMVRSSELFSGAVVDERAESIEFENGCVVVVYPCRPPAVRGLRAHAIILDELAHFRSSEMLPVDAAMVRAVRPCLLTTGGRLIILSSPHAQTGELWRLHRTHHGRDDSPVLSWTGTTQEMNPTVSLRGLEQMRADDPEGYRAEYEAEFLSGLSTLFDFDALTACVAPRRELPPAVGVTYRAFVDPSGGRRDAFTCAVGHQLRDRVVVDVVRAWDSPFNPTGVAAECAELLRHYRVTRVVGDRFAGEWPREALRAHHVRYDVSELDRSALYLGLLPLVNAGQVEIPDDRELLRELRGLERRRGPSGRDRVDHRAGGFDDRANALAGLCSLLLPRVREKVQTFNPDTFEVDPAPGDLATDSRQVDQAPFFWQRARRLR